MVQRLQAGFEDDSMGDQVGKDWRVREMKHKLSALETSASGLERSEGFKAASSWLLLDGGAKRVEMKPEASRTDC